MLKRLGDFIRRSNTTWTLGVLVGVGLLAGIILTVSFDATMRWTSTESFCTDACHEMTANVAKEFIGTSHDFNHSGVRTTCSDCHIC